MACRSPTSSLVPEIFLGARLSSPLSEYGMVCPVFVIFSLVDTSQAAFFVALLDYYVPPQIPVCIAWGCGQVVGNAPSDNFSAYVRFD